MAGIDKTYTDSYNEYIEFVNWAKGKSITFYNGYKENVSDYIYYWDEEDFTCERPIMNTPTWLDIYLIQNCPCKFVINRLKSVYNKNSFNEFKNIEFPLKLNPDYKQNRKIIIKNTPKTKITLNNTAYNGGTWWVQCENYDYGFNSEAKVWSKFDDYFPTNTNTMHTKTIKSLIRQLRKQYLPSGIKFRLIGRLVGEEYEIIVK